MRSTVENITKKTELSHNVRNGSKLFHSWFNSNANFVGQSSCFRCRCILCSFLLNVTSIICVYCTTNRLYSWVWNDINEAKWTHFSRLPCSPFLFIWFFIRFVFCFSLQALRRLCNPSLVFLLLLFRSWFRGTVHTYYYFYQRMKHECEKCVLLFRHVNWLRFFCPCSPLFIRLFDINWKIEYCVRFFA